MNEDIKVSVIIPVYNAEKYLRQCLESVINQTLQEIEIICVDDGSTDLSLEILQEYMTKDSRIHIVTQQNAGAGTARNVGLRISKGKYLSFLDADDFFELDMLERAFERIEHFAAQIIIFRANRFIQSEQKYSIIKWTIKEKQLPDDIVFPFRNISGNRFMCFVGWAWDKLFLRSFILENKLEFQEQRTTNDAFFVFMALVRAERICILNMILAHQRTQTEGTLSTTREKSWQCFYYALLKMREQIQEWGYWHWLEFDFVSYAVHFIKWNYTTLTETTKPKLYDALVSGWMKELGIFTYTREMYYNKGEYDWLMQTFCFEKAKDKLVEYSTSCAIDEILAIRNSKSYQIGQMITWWPRMIRKGLYCYREHGNWYTLNRILIKLHVKKER